MRFLTEFAALSLLLAVPTACKNDTETIPIVIQDEGEPDFPFDEPQPDEILFSNAELIYRGDDGGTGVSDLWQLSLWTDMPIDDTGNPVGPGKLIRLSLNAEILTEGAEIVLPAGIYYEPENYWSFLPFTFNEGEIQSIPLPTGTVDMPAYTFFGELAAGQTDYEPDLLREGYCQVQLLPDNTYKVSGILVGHRFLKRVFTFTGALEAIDRREEPQTGNSSLTADLEINGLKQARLKDTGNPYYLPADDGSGKPNATSYRAFRLVLAENGIVIDDLDHADSGKVLQMEIFVPYETDVQEGIPAGTYRIVPRIEGGVDRSDIVPGNIPAGVYDGEFKGAWYRRFAADSMQDFAAIEGGTLTVVRTESGHRLEFDFTDGADNPHRIYGSCTLEGAIPVL